MARKKAKVNENFSELDVYCIWLNEYYESLLRSGFTHSVALTLLMDKESYPEWVSFRSPEVLIQEEDDD